MASDPVRDSSDMDCGLWARTVAVSRRSMGTERLDDWNTVYRTPRACRLVGVDMRRTSGTWGIS